MPICTGCYHVDFPAQGGSTCFNKEYIIAAWWRFHKIKLLQSQTRRSVAQTLRSSDAWPFGRVQDQRLTVRCCLMIKTNVCVRETNERTQEIDAPQRIQRACTQYAYSEPTTKWTIETIYLLMNIYNRIVEIETNWKVIKNTTIATIAKWHVKRNRSSTSDKCKRW